MLLHVMDFEGNDKCGIIEYGIVSLDGTQITAAYTGLCCPDAPVDPKDVLLHGLRNDLLAGHPPFAEYRDFFYELRLNGVLAAHHASVENRLLSRYWSVVPSAKDHCVVSTGSWGPWVDSRIVAKNLCECEDYSLGSLIEQLSLSEKLFELVEAYCPTGRRKPHCALYDAIASALVLNHFQATENLDLNSLIRLSQNSSERKKADFAQEELF